MKALLPVLSLTLGMFGIAVSIRLPAKPGPEKVDFDRDVAPIVSQHCYKCHGPDAAKAAAGLRLDLFTQATKMLGDGAAIVPGSPEKSKLIERVSEKDAEMRMPPPDSGVKALTPEQIEILRTWIQSGAKYEKHWSYVSPTMPVVPKVSDPAWCKNDIDKFVLAKLDEAGLKPEPEADRDTLAMRAAESLTGLPPTRADLAAFRADLKPGAYERFVDKLLAEPTYGEDEARYWMDAVRYADTHGLQLDNERSIYPYRDWVIRSFNQDLPFDKFTEWQLAGDLLPNPTPIQLVATGYIRSNLTSNEGGAIEAEFLARNSFDRVDTTSTVFLGLTVGCAKCHDHKYDPIKQKDYYGLYALFDSTKDAPLDGNISLPPPVAPAPDDQQQAEMFAMQRRMDQIAGTVSVTDAASWCSQVDKSAPTTRDWQISPVYPFKNFDEAFDAASPGEPGQPAAAWRPLAFQVEKDNAALVGKDNATVYVKGTVTLPVARSMVLRVSSDDGIRMWLNGKLIHSHKIGRGLTDIDLVKADFKAGDNELISKVVNGVEPDGLNLRFRGALDEKVDQALAAYRKAPADKEAARDLRNAYLAAGPNSALAVEYRKLDKKNADLMASLPMTLIAQEMPTPRPTFILKRGQYDQLGDKVERHLPGFLGSFPGGEKVDRLALARWMISPSNPLVARVFVNRVWQQHFGTGIVKTVDDFGSQGEWPLNQPLLDFLSVNFLKGGWSVKKLNRMIVTSAAFRQSSKITSAKLAKDPENRLISRGPRFRLDAEVIRDKALVAGGLLQEKVGGHGFKPYQPSGLWEAASDPASETHVYVQDHGDSIYRRSLYLFWKRTSPPPIMTTFDAPLRDTCTVRRGRTNTPLQALATLNEPGYLEASRTMAQRLLQKPGSDDSRMQAAFDITLGRAPHPMEAALIRKALGFYRKRFTTDAGAAVKLLKVGELPQVKAISAPEQAAWMMVCSTLMNTDEFLSLH